MKNVRSHFLIITTTISFSLLTVSCGSSSGSASVDAALAQIEKVMDKVEKSKTSMNQADWQAFSDELEKPVKLLTDALDNDKIGTIKKLKISAVMLRYAVIASEAAVHTFSDSLQIKLEDKSLQEILSTDEMKEALQDAQKASEELKKLIK